KATLRRQVPEMHDDAAAHIHADYRAGIAEGRAIEFAITDQHYFANGVHHGLAFALRESFQLRTRFREFFGKRDLAASDKRLVVKEERARAFPIPGAREQLVSKLPANGKAERIVKFGALTLGAWQLLELSDKPQQWVVVAGYCGLDPFCPGDIRLDIRVFFKKGKKSWKCRPRSALILVVLPVVLPRNLDAVRNAAGEPAYDFEGKCVLHGCAGNARSIEIIEGGHIRVVPTQIVNSLFKSVELSLDNGNH